MRRTLRFLTKDPGPVAAIAAVITYAIVFWMMNGLAGLEMILSRVIALLASILVVIVWLILQNHREPQMSTDKHR